MKSHKCKMELYQAFSLLSSFLKVLKCLYIDFVPYHFHFLCASLHKTSGKNILAKDSAFEQEIK